MTEYTKAMKAAADEYARLVALAHEEHGGESPEPTPPEPTPPEPTPPPDIPPPETPDQNPPFNAAAFFNSLRGSLFGGSLSQDQVDGINLIGKACAYLLETDRWIFQSAYVLATVYHETAQTMQPIEEYYGSSQRYAPWYGRGYVQLTWEENYLKQQNKLGGFQAVVDSGIPYQVHDNWNNALHPQTSALITVGGMRDGDFTGKKLDDYNTEGANGVAEYDYVEARRIVNGTDRASQIAGYARDFEAALRTGLTPSASSDQHEGSSQQQQQAKAAKGKK